MKKKMPQKAIIINTFSFMLNICQVFIIHLCGSNVFTKCDLYSRGNFHLERS